MEANPGLTKNKPNSPEEEILEEEMSNSVANSLADSKSPPNCSTEGEILNTADLPAVLKNPRNSATEEESKDEISKEEMANTVANSAVLKDPSSFSGEGEMMEEEISSTGGNSSPEAEIVEEEMVNKVADSSSIFKKPLDFLRKEEAVSEGEISKEEMVNTVAYSSPILKNLSHFSKEERMEEEMVNTVDSPAILRSPPDSPKEETLEEEILTTVAKSPAIFKSQQKDDPELSFIEKRKIAQELLKKNHHQFLSRFGRNLKPHLLDFFTEKFHDYETTYHVKKLARFLNFETRRIDRKNRRFEALKNMMKKGDYFSESAMMKRNPLLYDNLVGRFLTEHQKKARDNIDTTNITFVNLLLEGIDREAIRNLKKSQEEAEDDVREETESDSDDFDDDDDDEDRKKCLKDGGNWGEIGEDKWDDDKRKIMVNFGRGDVDAEEQRMLKQEFVNQMYESFLEGRDEDFDYSTVDDNEVYDNVELRGQDEEEKYFDSESPGTMTNSPKKRQETEGESEDELDKYMRCLQVN